MWNCTAESTQLTPSPGSPTLGNGPTVHRCSCLEPGIILTPICNPSENPADSTSKVPLKPRHCPPPSQLPACCEPPSSLTCVVIFTKPEWTLKCKSHCASPAYSSSPFLRYVDGNTHPSPASVRHPLPHQLRPRDDLPSLPSPPSPPSLCSPSTLSRLGSFCMSCSLYFSAVSPARLTAAPSHGVLSLPF